MELYLLSSGTQAEYANKRIGSKAEQYCLAMSKCPVFCALCPHQRKLTASNSLCWLA